MAAQRPLCSSFRLFDDSELGSGQKPEATINLGRPEPECNRPPTKIVWQTTLPDVLRRSCPRGLELRRGRSGGPAGDAQPIAAAGPGLSADVAGAPGRPGQIRCLGAFGLGPRRASNAGSPNGVTSGNLDGDQEHERILPRLFAFANDPGLPGPALAIGID